MRISIWRVTENQAENLANAIERFESALGMFGDSDLFERAATLMSLDNVTLIRGELLRDRGSLDRALAAFAEALRISRLSGNERQAGNAEYLATRVREVLKRISGSSSNGDRRASSPPRVKRRSTRVSKSSAKSSSKRRGKKAAKKAAKKTKRPVKKKK
jgi:tetratricopeptide (TPR) repeat protein